MLNALQPIPVAARSKAWVCGRSLAGIAGSNPTGGMDVCVLVSTVEHNYLVADVCYLLHKYQLHVSALMAIFRLNELTKNIGNYIWHASYIRWRGGYWMGGRDLVCIE